jgi:uncharacterized protein (TIGR00369 family)
MTSADRAADIGRLIEAMPFAAGLGIELSVATRDEVRGGLAWDPALCTVGGVMHGGALMTLADSLGAVCAYLNLSPDTTTATIESKTNLFRAVRSGRVSAVTRPLHTGRTLIVVQTDLYDDRDRRVAQVTQTQAVLPTGQSSGA